MISFIIINNRLLLLQKSIPVFTRSLRLLILNFNILFQHIIKVDNKLSLELSHFNSQNFSWFIHFYLQLLQLILQIMNISLCVSRWAIIQLFNLNIRIQVSIMDCTHTFSGFFKHFLLDQLLMRDLRLLINAGCHLSFFQLF